MKKSNEILKVKDWLKSSEEGKIKENTKLTAAMLLNSSYNQMKGVSLRQYFFERNKKQSN
jgi:hypothetical protein